MPSDVDTPYKQDQQMRSEQQLLDMEGLDCGLQKFLSTPFRDCPRLTSVHFTMSISSGTQRQCNREFREPFLRLAAESML